MAERIQNKRENIEGGKEAFFERTQDEERGTAKGILSKINKIPKGLRKGILMLAAAGTILSATEASARHRHGHQNEIAWDQVIGVVVQAGIYEIARQKTNPYENRRYESSHEYRMQAQMLRREAHQAYYAEIQSIEAYARREMYQIEIANLPPLEKAQARSQLERLVYQRKSGSHQEYLAKMARAQELEQHADAIDRGHRR